MPMGPEKKALVPMPSAKGIVLAFFPRIVVVTYVPAVIVRMTLFSVSLTKITPAAFVASA